MIQHVGRLMMPLHGRLQAEPRGMTLLHGALGCVVVLLDKHDFIVYLLLLLLQNGGQLFI